MLCREAVEWQAKPSSSNGYPLIPVLENTVLFITKCSFFFFCTGTDQKREYKKNSIISCLRLIPAKSTKGDNGSVICTFMEIVRGFTLYARIF
jgi:hypothetical protein